ncbi:MAG: carbamoyl-phosphate synthase large subunit [Gaiellaceae bacterium]|nr:carbamoyl-phosphate synthase large subunit [Gaiellaceae bacterium]
MVVLFTCAGRRADIVSAFGAAGATTLATDTSELAPALYVADRHALVPRVDDPGYVAALAELVRVHGAELVVPLTDLDHRVLAARGDELDALVLLPDLPTVERTADKYLAHLFFQEHGIPSPPTWLPEAVPALLDYPVLVKAREGFGANHIYRAKDRAELDFFLGYTTEPSMVQQVCQGTEYSIDVFCDLDGVCLNAVPRTMIHSTGGESVKGMTIKDWDLINFGAHVAETLRLRGPGCIQCFREADGTHQVTDVNPRFGGAFPLPTAAGSRYPELALALAAGEHPEPRLGDFQEGVVMSRYLAEIILVRNGDGTLAPLERAASAEPS